jgi:hypothetical protein
MNRRRIRGGKNTRFCEAVLVTNRGRSTDVADNIVVFAGSTVVSVDSTVESSSTADLADDITNVAGSTVEERRFSAALEAEMIGGFSPTSLNLRSPGWKL